jgi:hypothetical protein
MDILDSEIRYAGGLAYMTAWAGMHAHPNADFSKAFDTLRTLYVDVMAEIPYITGGKSGGEVAHDERMAFVERYKEYRKKVHVEKAPTKKFEVKPVGKKVKSNAIR